LKWFEALDAGILHLARTGSCFQKIINDERLGYCLPPKSALAGTILKHCTQVVNQVIAKYEPLIYKVGYTHCPHTRFTNRKFGYVLDRERWERMLVLYAAGEVVSPAFVEAALIQHFKGNMVTNSC